MLLAVLLGMGSSAAWADDTSTLTFTTKCNGSGTADNDALWTVTSDGTESNFDEAKGIHYGTGSAQVQYIRLSTSDIPGTITEVVVNASTASGVSATASVTVGGNAFGGDPKSLSSSADNYTFTGSASGEIVVTVTKPSKAVKAIYVKSVKVTYTTGGGTPTCATPTFSPAAGTYNSAQSVTISSETNDATIYYTTDGTDPSSSSTQYTTAISVSESMTIKAIAVKDGNNDSEVATAAYTINTSVATTTTIDATGITNTDVYPSTEAGTLSAIVKDNDGNPIDGATITWSGDNDAVATIDAATGVVTLVAAGDVTFTATYAGVEGEYDESSATYDLTITDSTPIPTHTATFSVNGETTSDTFEEGAAITFPANPGVLYDKTFVGWVAEAIDGTTDDAPEFVTSATMGDSDVTYYAVFALASDGSAEIVDKLDNALTGVSITTYTSWSNKTDKSSAVYAGQSAGSYGSIQLRSSNNNSGVVTTSSGGNVKKVTVAWNSNTVAGRTLNVYGKHSAYSDASDLYNGSKQGTLLGSIGKGKTEFTIDGNYEYIGFCSASGALYLDEVQITWSTGGGVSYSDYCTTVAAAVPVTSVSVDATASVYVGETTTLTATVLPDNATNKNVTWESDDETIATVDESGVVTGVAAGEAIITVTSVADNTKTATCAVTVTPVAVTGVSVDASATVKIGKTVTLTPTISPDNATNKNVTWESDDETIATVDESGVVTGVAAGEATITVKSEEDPTKSASCTVTVITAGDGTKAKPYDVEEAIALINTYDSGDGPDGYFYVKGKVSTAATYMNSDNTLTYYISDDGKTTSQLQVYKGKNIDNTDFSSENDLKVDDEIIVYGPLLNYKGTKPEINTGNYIYSLNGVKIPEITFGEDSYEVLYNGSLTITATADGNGAITYSSSDATVAEIDETTGIVTPHKTGEVTITATIAASDNNIAGSKDVTLTVTDGRASAEIAFAEVTITKTWGEAFTGQALTNPNSVAVTYESSVPEVATVDESGVVTIVKAGETVITASFAGDGEYIPAEVSYTLTVNKADAGLSFTVTAYDFDLNDDSFTGVAVNNPNSLTVIYESSDEDIALVDENDGTLVLDASAEGFVTITATFAGNDWYSAGNASYTITITDPDRKGTKNNPYTVAEVNSGSYSGYNYVKGYIVGFFDAYNKDAKSSGNSNLALSDTPDEIGGANTIAVQLPSGAIREAWNIDDNDVIGYEVIVYGNITGYFTNKTGVKNTSEISAVSVPVTVSAAGYTTITTKYAVNFEGTDVTAYKATAVNPSSIHLEEVDEAPAGTPLIIEASEGMHTGIAIISSAADIADNLLLSSDGTVAGDGSTIYALGVGKVEPYYGVVGFYVVNDGQTVPAGKAYLTIAAEVKEFLTFDFGELPTGLNDVRSKMEDVSGDIFNLAGQKMNRLQKGINIVNGRKVLVK